MRRLGYRFPTRVSREQLLRQEQLPNTIRDTAWGAQERLCGRYRANYLASSRRLSLPAHRPATSLSGLSRLLRSGVWPRTVLWLKHLISISKLYPGLFLRSWHDF